MIPSSNKMTHGEEAKFHNNNLKNINTSNNNIKYIIKVVGNDYKLIKNIIKSREEDIDTKSQNMTYKIHKKILILTRYTKIQK